MSCSRCGGSSRRQVPPPTVARPGSQTPRPPQNGGTRPDPSAAVREAINGMRLPYVPPTGR